MLYLYVKTQEIRQKWHVEFLRVQFWELFYSTWTCSRWLRQFKATKYATTVMRTTQKPASPYSPGIIIPYKHK